jgi:preprotein translocase subunit SecD
MPEKRLPRLGHGILPFALGAFLGCEIGVDTETPLKQGTELTYSLDLSRVEDDQSKAVEEAKRVVTQRLKGYGLRKFYASIEHENQLLVQLPGMDAKVTGELKKLIEKPGAVSFRLVAPEEQQAREKLLQNEEEERKYFEADLAWVARKRADPSYKERRPEPPAVIVRTEVEKVNEEFRPKPTGKRALENHHVYDSERKVWELVDAINGNHLSRVASKVDQQTFKPVVAFQLNKVGAKLFGDLTGKNVGHQLAIVLDDDIFMVATISSQIADRVELWGHFSDDDVKSIVLLVRGGNLPVKPLLIAERTLDTNTPGTGKKPR